MQYFQRSFDSMDRTGTSVYNISVTNEDRIAIVKEHFDSAAVGWDERAMERIPFYKEMMGVLVSMLPFKKEQEFSVIDLGTGTGTIAYLIKQAFPSARITCMDIAPQMLEMSKKKLGGFSGITYEQADLVDYQFNGKYDAVVSSLAMHHLEPDKDKKDFFTRVFNALNAGGVFLNADIILADDENTQGRYLKEWGKFVLSNLSEEEMKANLARYYREDRPNKLNIELDWLRKGGFSSVDVHFKYYNFAVYGAIK
jgi:tRNA (cmo5U34)-methyltransferase